jgi:hypothetical protein
MAKKSDYISGSPTEGNLKRWADYASQNSQVNATKDNQEPWREAKDPDSVRKLSGDTTPASWSRGDASPHRFPKNLSGGAGGGLSRGELSKIQSRKRGGA